MRKRGGTVTSRAYLSVKPMPMSPRLDAAGAGKGAEIEAEATGGVSDSGSNIFCCLLPDGTIKMNA